jgi:glycosyltransferase involved in cell wall biosynthesis
MHLFINFLAASAGGGQTYVRNVIPHLVARSGLRVTVALGSGLREEFQAFGNVDFLDSDFPPARRFWYEQATLPGVIRRCGADVLLSAGNFALRNSPVPQILLSRNSIYTSADYFRDLRSRSQYRLWLETQFRAVLAKKSIGWADVTVAPSEAFANELRRWTGAAVSAIHHGFDHDAFFRDHGPLDSTVEEKLRSAEGCLKLLFVSHYNYYRNFETLFRAIPRLRNRMAGRAVKLLLTCNLRSDANPGGYDSKSAARLVEELGISGEVVELGAVPYRQLHQVYRRSDVYVSPAYTETFAHPLVEAMASGLPVVASDLEVHREVCGDAAIYFPRFSSEALAGCLAQVAQLCQSSRDRAALGLLRSRQFSWKTHVDEILGLCKTLIDSKIARDTNSPEKVTLKKNRADSV